MRLLGAITLSPSRAQTGIAVTARSPSLSANSRNASTMPSNTARSNPTRSILFTASTICPMPSRLAMVACRRVCTSKPLRASTSSTAMSASRGAGHHVAGVLLVAGRVGEDEAPARSLEIAVGEVDGDALLALGGEPVDQQRVVDLAARRAVFAAVALEGGHHVVGDVAALEQQPADQGRLAVIHAAAGEDAKDRLGHQK